MPRSRSEKTVANWRNRCRRAGESPVPLRITAHMAAPLAGPIPYVQLDALLTVAAVHHAHYPGANRPVAPLSSDRDIAPVALPLAHDWRTWCASALTADGVTTPSGRARWRMRPAMEYAHLLSSRQVSIKHGTTRAHQGEITLWSASTLTAWCLGDPDLIGKLLRSIPSVGAERSQGYGRVAHWDITEDEAARVGWLTTADGRLARHYPHPSGTPAGIVPPYWYRPWWTAAVAPGDRAPDDLGRTPVPESTVGFFGEAIGGGAG